MKNLGWKAASIAFLTLSALLGVGHDLLEEKQQKEEMKQAVREEVERQLAERNGEGE